MSRLPRFGLALALVAGAFLTSALLYPFLPPILPTHWNAAGAIDGWMPKSRGAFIAPGVSLVIVGFLIAFEPASIREDGDDLKLRYYPGIVAAVAGLNFFVNLEVLLAGLGKHLDIPAHLAVAVGLLFVVLGNSLGKLPRNGTIGIRTPWTLADAQVWSRTHRVGGWLLVLAGVVMVVAGIGGWGPVPGLIAVGAALLMSVGYSYVLWRRVRDRGTGAP